MAAITDLQQLLSSMSPELLPETYVFCTVEGKLTQWIDSAPIATFAESEGITLVLGKNTAIEKGLAFDGEFRCITLTVHSSLEAVGLTAAVSTKLAEHNISANVIAAYYHDHIFVPKARADDAIAALKELIRG
uniref:ACT domain-containing protein n=1 Tax=Thaumasiovibrio occultus TaxID=1891184 RepID=UPI000B35ACE1|nr:ACT domain-containing protein [Thaumasiovibrio occultus]